MLLLGSQQLCGTLKEFLARTVVVVPSLGRHSLPQLALLVSKAASIT